MTSRERKLKEQRRIDREKKKIKQEGTTAAINILQVLPCYILAYKCNFGNLRLERFISELYRLTEKIKNDERLLATMIKELEYDKGIRIDIESGDVDNIWRDEGDTRKVVNKPRKAAKK